jgi:mannose-6-phosphate isomerase-like protein (cupin superfamily)
MICGAKPMSLLHLDSIANALPGAWRSTVIGQVGPARMKVLRMDEGAYGEETHDYDEGLLVINGQMRLFVTGETIVVEAGQMYLARAGVPHAVLPGSHGTLVIVDV